MFPEIHTPPSAERARNPLGDIRDRGKPLAFHQQPKVGAQRLPWNGSTSRKTVKGLHHPTQRCRKRSRALQQRAQFI